MHQNNTNVGCLPYFFQLESGGIPVHVPQGMVLVFWVVVQMLNMVNGGLKMWRVIFLVCFKAMSDNFDLFLDEVGVDDMF